MVHVMEIKGGNGLNNYILSKRFNIEIRYGGILNLENISRYFSI